MCKDEDTLDGYEKEYCSEQELIWELTRLTLDTTVSQKGVEYISKTMLVNYIKSRQAKHDAEERAQNELSA